MKDLECHSKNVLYSQNMVPDNLHQSPLRGLLKMHVPEPQPSPMDSELAGMGAEPGNMHL